MSLISTMFEACMVRLERPKATRDLARGTGQSWTTTHTNYPCSVQQSSSAMQLMFGQRNTPQNTVIYFAQDPDTAINDRMYIQDRTSMGTTRTLIYRVDSDVQPVGRGKFWSVDATYVKQAGA